MTTTKRKTLTGRGVVGKIAVVGIKDRETNQIRAEVVGDTIGGTLKGFIAENAKPTARVYTDESTAYSNLPFTHEAVTHSVGEYVKNMVHVNGIESFWSTLKRAHKGVFHRLFSKHFEPLHPRIYLEAQPP